MRDFDVYFFSEGFETRIGPYSLTKKTLNRSFLQFFLHQELLYGKKSRDLCELRSDLMVLRIVNGFSGSYDSFFFSKYRLKLKIWHVCTLDFFQIWNQKICEGKKNKLRRRK